MCLKIFLGFFVTLNLVILTGCESIGGHQAPVVEGSSQTSFISDHKKRGFGDYRVKRGDTLYSIAWANNLDYRTLAEMNYLKSPYKIYAGQYLKTRVGFFHSLSLMFKTGKRPVSQKKYVKKSFVKKRPIRFQRMPVKDNARYEIIRANESSSYPSRMTRVSPPITKYPKLKIPAKGWRWPSNGKIVQGYSNNTGGNKGLDFSASYGAPVFAAASGKVVYSGSGLKGYGKLLLVKHNNSFLSAYANNKHLLVKEGDNVLAGQKIAEMGRANHGQVRLHFEIRQNGQPVNPMIYLANARR